MYGRKGIWEKAGKLGFACAIALGLSLASIASASLIQFQLHDHPDGTEGGDYGLRLDDPNTSATNTFGFDNVTGALNTDTGQFHIYGDVTHRQTGDAYSIDAYISISSPIDEAALLNPSGSFSLLTGATTSLTLSGAGGFSPTEWTGFGMGQDPAVDNFHIDTNHRGVGNDTLAGWGWLAPEDNYPNGHVNYQDWLFTMDSAVVPEPTTMTLLGLGVAGMGLRRFRRGKAREKA